MPPEKKQQPKKERKILGMSMPVALAVFGGALLIGIIWYMRKKQQAASSTASVSAEASAGTPPSIQQNMYTNYSEEQALYNWIQQLASGETALSKQIDALSLQSYSQTRYLAGQLGAQLGPPTWRGTPGPTPWPSWILNAPSNQPMNATIGQPSVPNPLSTNSLQSAGQYGGTSPTSNQGVSS
jgi:hypothetical protein